MPQTLEALSAIGAFKTRDLLVRAIDIAYPEGFPSDSQRHDEMLADTDEVYDSLNLLDEKFYMYEDSLSDLVNKYLADNALRSE